MTKPILGAALVLAALLLPTVAAAEPRLKPAVSVWESSVRLGDIFDDAGPLAEVPVLAAPAPGEEIVLSLAQAFEIANRHGLAWRPVAAFDAVHIQRAWRYLPDARIMDALEAALRQAGMTGDLEIELHGAAVQVKVGDGMIVDLRTELRRLDAGSGRFAAALYVAAAGEPPQSFDIFGRATATVAIPVLKRRLRPEDIIGESDIDWVEVAADRVDDDTVIDAVALIGSSPVRTLTPHRPIAHDDIGPPTLVRIGDLVAMHFTAANMRLVATGLAVEGGAFGDVIRVTNTQSELVVEARIAGPNRVEVASRPLMVSR